MFGSGELDSQSVWSVAGLSSITEVELRVPQFTVLQFNNLFRDLFGKFTNIMVLIIVGIGVVADRSLERVISSCSVQLLPTTFVA